MLDHDFERAPGQSVVSFDRLVRVSCRSQRDTSSIPVPHHLPAQHVGEVLLHQDDRREVVARPHLELGLIASGKAIVASVRAAPIRVQGPAEGHPLHPIQGAPTRHFLIGRAVSLPHRGWQAREPVALQSAGNLFGGWGRGVVERGDRQEGVVHGIRYLFAFRESSLGRCAESSTYVR